jgi:putative ATPase
LRDGHYAGAKRLGHGEGYQYPHDHAGGVIDQDYLGVDKTYFTPTDRGYEGTWAINQQSVRPSSAPATPSQSPQSHAGTPSDKPLG